MAIESSLIMGLRSFGRYEECVETAANMMSLPSSTVSRAYVAFFSMVQWSNNSKVDLIEDINQVLLFSILNISAY